jgi:hypothetical protein
MVAYPRGSAQLAVACVIGARSRVPKPRAQDTREVLDERSEYREERHLQQARSGEIDQSLTRSVLVLHCFSTLP